MSLNFCADAFLSLIFSQMILEANIGRIITNSTYKFVLHSEPKISGSGSENGVLLSLKALGTIDSDFRYILAAFKNNDGMSLFKLSSNPS